jgi:hypothetical protein
MVHKTYIIPGLSNFIDKTVLSQYAPTSIKRIIAAGALAIYLQQNSNLVDVIINNPIFNGLGVSNDAGMVNIELIRDVLKSEINKAGFMRIKFPILGDVDFTSEDMDTLYASIMAISNTPQSISLPTKYEG